MPDIPLAVLDLVPITSGSTATQALRNSIDLARHAERFGYARYWVAEHHLNPGVAGTAPAVVLALTAAATSTIRIGSGALQMGHRTALSAVEEFGLIDALHPGRLDLGLGRSGRPSTRLTAEPAPVREPVAAGSVVTDGRARNGLVIPAKVSLKHLLSSPRFAAQRQLLTLPGAEAQDYAQQVLDILDLLAGTYLSADGIPAHVVPGEGAAVEVWILGSSGGESAEVAGRHGLPFAANYHVSPSTVLEAVEAYRAAFSPSDRRDSPYVSVSADVVVAEDRASAVERASGYAPWVRSIRSGQGAIPYPGPAEARAVDWAEEDRALVADRLDTQFVGTAADVADRLEQLQDATGADELLVTTITHEHADRIRSYELLAAEWRRRQPGPAATWTP